MFTVQSQKTDDWIKTNGNIVIKDNIDSYIPNLDTDSARVELENLQNIQNKINETKGSWDDYNNQFQDGRTYLLDYAKQNKVLEASVDNVKQANQAAREAAINHNNALKQQTLGAKAATAATKALAMAGNMLVAFLVTKSIELFVKALDKSTDSLADVEARIQENQNTLSDYTSKIEELTEKLENLNNTDTTYFSDELKAALETETAYVESQIELYTLLADAKQRAINEDYIKAATGENEEFFFKKAWNELSNGEWSDLISTFSDVASKQWVNFILPGLGAFAKVDDGNYISEADKLLEEYQDLQEEYSNLKEFAGIHGTDELLEKNISNVKSKMIQQSAKIAEQIENIKTARDSLTQDPANVDTVAKLDAKIKQLQTGLYTPDYELEKAREDAGQSSAENLEKTVMSFSKLIESDDFAEIRNDLIGLAQAGKLDEDALRSYEHYNDILKALGASATLSEDEIASMIEVIESMSTKNSIDDLNNYGEALNKLDDAYTSFLNGEQITASQLSSLMSSFGDLDSYQEFEKEVLSGNTELQNSFNALASELSANVLAGLTENNKGYYESELYNMGIQNAHDIVEQALAPAREQKQQMLEELSLINNSLIESSEDLEAATWQEVSALVTEAEQAGVTAQALAFYAIQKYLTGNNPIETAEDCQKLINLAKSAGFSMQVLSELDSLQLQLNDPFLGFERTKSIATRITKILNDAAANANQYDFSAIFGSADDARSTFKATEADYKSLLDKDLTLLEEQLKAGLISFQNYTNQRKAIIESYYQQGKLSADEYYSYLENHYDNQLSYMDKVVNAVTRRIDKEIDALEKQKSAIEDSYQEQIDSLEEQKTLLQEANQERERQLNLQKSLYDLERARNQRSILMYSEGQGMHYVADEDAIRDARQAVEDAELDIEIAKLDSAIAELEEARDRETAAIDEMISKLQEYKEQWNDITSAYEEEQENLLAAQILGQEWEQDILAGRLDTLIKFKDDYIAIQQAMADAAYQAAQAMENAEKVTIKDTSKEKLSGLSKDNSTDNKKNDAPVKSDSTAASPQRSHNSSGLLLASTSETAPEHLLPLSADDPILQMGNQLRTVTGGNVSSAFEGSVLRQMHNTLVKMASSIPNNTANTRHIQQEFHISLPNVTDHTAAVNLLSDLESLATKKLQAF